MMQMSSNLFGGFPKINLTYPLDSLTGDGATFKKDKGR